MPTTSTVPDAIADLIAKATATKADEGTIVIDSYSTGTLPDSYIGIAFSGDSESPGVEFVGAIMGGSSIRTQEDYNINCSCSTWTGDSDPATARVNVLAIFDPLAAAINADPRLSRSVMQATVTVADLFATQVSNGSTATIQFVVTVRAFRKAG